MKKPMIFSMVLAISAFSFAALPSRVSAEDLLTSITNWLKGPSADIPPPQACGQCGYSHKSEYCVERIPVETYVKGKKKVYDSKVRYEYVSIPEIRYRYVNRLVRKKIPCDYCKPVCETSEVEHCYQIEHWETKDHGCGKLHCKTCVNKTEKQLCKKCGNKPGKTTIKVHYWSCVKEPYTVYRQVKKPVCVKQPRYVSVDVPITKYVCKHCKGGGCGQCSK